MLTRWTEHLEVIVEILAAAQCRTARPPRPARARRPAPPSSSDSPNLDADGGLVLAATAGLIGEGFDCPPLDTLFLAFPIKFKGNVVQYVGRVLRPTDTKTRVEVHDYVDVLVPVLARMHNERRAAYATLGFDLPRAGRRRPGPPRTAKNTPTDGDAPRWVTPSTTSSRR